MEQYIHQNEVQNFLILPNSFDWDLVDQEIGFAKVFDFFPKELYQSFEYSQEKTKQNLFKLLTKAGVYYSFIFSIPKIKVHISNYGLQEFNQDKVKPSQWWDVRDLGLSMLKVADRALSDALALACKDEIIKKQIPLFLNLSEFIATPEELEKIYSINYSPDVFLQLQKFITKSLNINVFDKIKPDCLESVKQNDFLLPFLKDALVFYSLYYASLLPNFIFTQNAVVVQYEELPWQKSIVLDATAKLNAGNGFLKLADGSMKIITDYMKKHPDDFPCSSLVEADRKVEIRDSGIYF